MKQKKAQNISMNVIIIALLGLIVLVVIVSIFSGKIGLFNKSVGGTCKDQGGECMVKCNSDYPVRIIAKGCDSEGKDNTKETGPCCIPSLLE